MMALCLLQSFKTLRNFTKGVGQVGTLISGCCLR